MPCSRRCSSILFCSSLLEQKEGSRCLGIQAAYTWFLYHCGSIMFSGAGTCNFPCSLTNEKAKMRWNRWRKYLLPHKMEDAIQLVQCAYITLISIRRQAEKRCPEGPFLMWLNTHTIVSPVCKLLLVGKNMLSPMTLIFFPKDTLILPPFLLFSGAYHFWQHMPGHSFELRTSPEPQF